MEDYYNMSFMNRLSDLAQKAEKARNKAENQYELAEDYWTVDELPGYLEEAAKFARKARAKATDAQTLLTEAVKAADDIKSMVYINQGSVSLEELAANITRKVQEIKDIINNSTATAETWEELLGKLDITVAQAEEVPALAQQYFNDNKHLADNIEEEIYHLIGLKSDADSYAKQAEEFVQKISEIIAEAGDGDGDDELEYGEIQRLIGDHLATF